MFHGLPPIEAVIFEGATLLMEDRLVPDSLRIENGQITGIDVPADGARRIDARGMILAPAMIDIHGDAFERHIMPRPGVFIPIDTALLETDRQLAANGIATAYHALTLSWEPGLRSVDQGTKLVDALARLAPRLTVENRVQLRWETFCFEAIDLIEAALAGPLAPSIAFNDHTSMALLHPDTPLQDRPFDHSPDFPVADTTTPRFAAKMKARGERSGMTAEAFVSLLNEVWDRRPQVPAAIERLAAMGRDKGAPMLSHDDSQIETRDYYRALGARISEFPMSVKVAEAARAAGDMIAFGAPNGMRGGSHLGSPGAADMIAAGLCDILASDYFYPAMLGAVARLHADKVAPLPKLWDLVSGGPARASGLTDRGRLAAGLRADLVLLDWPEGGTPVPRLTLVGGRQAYGAMATGA